MFQFVLALQLRLLGTDQAENDGPVLRDLAQWLETARAPVAIFQQEALEASVAENLRDGTVVAGGVKLALIVSPAQVQTEHNSRMITDHRVIHLDREIKKLVGIVSALTVAFAQLRIEQGGVLRRVDLNVSTAETDQFLDFIPQNVYQVGQVILDFGICG